MQTIYYDDAGAEPRAFDLAFPDVVSRHPIALVHGGGWNAGDRSAYHPLLRWFVDHGHPCATIGYRTAGGTSIEQKIADVSTGYLGFQDALAERNLGAPVLMGSSAGAHLVSLIAEAGPGKWAPELAHRWVPPAACIPVNGPGTLEYWDGIHPNIQEAVEDMCGASYGETTEPFSAISPHNLVPDAPLSPFLILLAETEKVFPHAYVYAWADTLRANGTQTMVEVVPGSEHGFLYNPDGDAQRYALNKVEEFLTSLERSNRSVDLASTRPGRTPLTSRRNGRK